jgi:DNA polymerase-3 subunit delta
MQKGSRYLFTGPEIGEKYDEVDRIRTALRKQYGGSFEETSFYALETTAGEITSDILSGSLFSTGRLFLIKNSEAIKKKEEVKLLASCLESIDEHTTVILLSDENNIDKTLEKCEGVQKRIFYEMFENRKKEWLSSFFRREGYSASDAAIETILELVENNTDALRSNCRTLFLFCDKNRTITETDVERLLSHTRAESTFTLFSAIAAGNLERSIEILHTLLDAKESAVSIFAGLLWCWHKLRDYAAQLAQGAANDSALRSAGIFLPKAKEDYRVAARRYDVYAAGKCAVLTVETDINIRSLGAPLERVLLERYLIAVHRAAHS